MRLKGRSAIVTGAASGIGHATATLFAEEGARVLAVDRPETGMAETYAGASNIVLCEQDLAAAEAAEAVVAQALDAHGGIDILYNNAGVSGRAKFDEMTDDIWERVIDVNLTAGYKLTRAAVPALKQSAAPRIIFTASVMARMTDYRRWQVGDVRITRVVELEMTSKGHLREPLRGNRPASQRRR